jgi:arginase family enzyme
LQGLNALSTDFVRCAGIAIIRGFSGINLIGMDIVEVAPAYDPQPDHGTGCRAYRLRSDLPLYRT